jgi:hypothetical protein
MDSYPLEFNYVAHGETSDPNRHPYKQYKDSSLNKPCKKCEELGWSVTQTVN